MTKTLITRKVETVTVDKANESEVNLFLANHTQVKDENGLPTFIKRPNRGKWGIFGFSEPTRKLEIKE